MNRGNSMPGSLLSKTALGRLLTLLEARASMSPIPVDHPVVQHPATSSQIFELRKNGSSYTLAPTDPNAVRVPAVDGGFAYVVMPDDPCRVYVGKLWSSINDWTDPALLIDGHTSLTGRDDVLYAGEISFDHGKLSSWNNASGHYRPAGRLRHVNLLPPVRALLPEHKFAHYKFRRNFYYEAPQPHLLAPVERAPGAFMARGHIVQHAGAGLQLFGIYNGVRGMIQAIEHGDTGQALLQASGLGAQGVGLATEIAIPKLAHYLEAGNSNRFNVFAASRFGEQLGGAARMSDVIGHSGALAGALIMEPFDIYNAVTAFRQASHSTGKKAQDLYVDGAIATTSAVLSGALALAAFAGFTMAGPLGVVAGFGLALGSAIYHSVRDVEDRNRDAHMSAGERFETGLRSFLGMSTSPQTSDNALRSTRCLPPPALPLSAKNVQSQNGREVVDAGAGETQATSACVNRPATLAPLPMVPSTDLLIQADSVVGATPGGGVVTALGSVRHATDFLSSQYGAPPSVSTLTST